MSAREEEEEGKNYVRLPKVNIRTKVTREPKYRHTSLYDEGKKTRIFH